MPDQQQPGEMPTNESGENPQPATGGKSDAELDTLKAALRKANAEAAERRKRIEQLEADEKRRADEQLSEVEKAVKRAAAAEAELESMRATLRERAIRYAVESEAARAGFVDPADAVALADLTAVQYDDGTVTGAESVVKALAKAKPHLLKVAQPAPPNTNGRDGGKSQGTSIDEIIARKRASGMYTPI